MAKLVNKNPNIYNVGYSKDYDEEKYTRKKYELWYDIISRCYNKNDTNYKYYGKKGVRVSKRWLHFKNFLNDLEDVEGYNKEKFKNHELDLDKDIKSNSKNKIYSKDTCKFVSHKDNMYETCSYFKIIMPNSKVYYYRGYNILAKNTLIKRGSSISARINDKKGTESLYNMKIEKCKKMEITKEDLKMTEKAVNKHILNLKPKRLFCFKIITPNKKEFLYDNMKDLHREIHELYPTYVGKCLNGKRESYKNLRFTMSSVLIENLEKSQKKETILFLKRYFKEVYIKYGER